MSEVPAILNTKGALALSYILERLSERSTALGLILSVGVIVGHQLAPAYADGLAQVLVLVAGAALVTVREQKGAPAP